MKNIFLTLLIFATVLSACEKKLSDIPDTGNGNGNGGPAVEKLIKTTIKVLVVNETGSIVFNAKVQAENTTVYTNEFGIAEFKDITVVSKRALIKVNVKGYFEGYRTFAAEEGKECFGKIKLVPYPFAANVQAATGGVVQIGNEVSITFPPNAFVNESDGSDYTGTAEVYAKYLSPEDPELNVLMPGDLIAEDNGSVLLRTFGMVNVEIQSSSQQRLKLKSNVKAVIKTVIPASQLSGAPATVPLWYFDTKKGIWVKDGTATRQGNTYTGDVSHFTWWNYDYAYPRVYISGKITDAAGVPYVNTIIRMSTAAYDVSLYSHTNNEGYFTIPAPPNVNCVISIITPDCNINAFSTAVNTGNTDINIGTIVTNISIPNRFRISGNFENCNNQPVQSGVMRVYCPNNVFEGKINNGTADVSFLFCSDSTDALIVTEDFTSGKIYTTNKKIYKKTVADIGSQNVCEVVSGKYIRYIVDNKMYYIAGNNIDSLTSHYFGFAPPWVQVAHNNWSTRPLTTKIYFNTDMGGFVTVLIIRDYPNLSNYGGNIQLQNKFENYSNTPGTINKGTVNGRMFDTGISQWRNISIAYSVGQE